MLPTPSPITLYNLHSTLAITVTITLTFTLRSSTAGPLHSRPFTLSKLYSRFALGAEAPAAEH